MLCLKSEVSTLVTPKREVSEAVDSKNCYLDVSHVLSRDRDLIDKICASYDVYLISDREEGNDTRAQSQDFAAPSW